MRGDKELLTIAGQLLGLFLVGYLAVTAFVGYQVGRAIHTARASNLMVSSIADVLGIGALEQFAIHGSNVPPIVQDSPAFWLALRVTE